jgi:hypothetical protein
MDAPVVTSFDIRQLLGSPAQEPVLYLKAGPDDEGGELEADVWASAYVHHSKVIVRRGEVVDAIGDDPDDDAVKHYLTLLKQTVAEVTAALA